MLETGPAPLVVYKIGGSLLDLPDLAQVVRSVITQRPGCASLLVTGGGDAADLVRGWDVAHALGSDAAHWLALDAMRLNESLIARLLPECRPVRSAAQAAAAAHAGRVGLLCADCFVRWGEAQGHAPLPRSWEVTSDSIAAWAATVLRADELVLLKSADLPASRSLSAAADAGLIDPHFPSAAARLSRVSWANGRATPVVVCDWPVALPSKP